MKSPVNHNHNTNRTQLQKTRIDATAHKANTEMTKPHQVETAARSICDSSTHNKATADFDTCDKAHPPVEDGNDSESSMKDVCNPRAVNYARATRIMAEDADSEALPAKEATKFPKKKRMGESCGAGKRKKAKIAQRAVC